MIDCHPMLFSRFCVHAQYVWLQCIRCTPEMRSDG